MVTLTISCDSSQANSGPTLVHSTGVPGYKIPPEIIRILQESFGNERLCDDEQGVLCSVPSQSVLAALRKNGFTLDNQTSETNRELWTLTQSSSGEHHPQVPREEHHPQVPREENPREEQKEEPQGENDEEKEEGGEEEEEEEQ